LLVLQSGRAGLASAPPPIFIDDSRDGVQCPGARDIVDLFTMNPFPVKDGQTITFCSGEYNGTLGIDGAHNVTITGVVDPTLGPGAHHPGAVAGEPRQRPPGHCEHQELDQRDDQQPQLGRRAQGSITANWTPASTDMNGIHVVNSSVTITDNAIWRIHPQRPKPKGGTGSGRGHRVGRSGDQHHRQHDL